MINIITAATRDGLVIGTKDGKIPWHIKKDFQYFKDKTTGHPIIMGRKTFESLPGILPNRTHVVITRQEEYQVPEGVIKANTLEEGIKLAQNLDSEVYIIGGGEIYKQAISLADRLYITLIDTHIDIQGEVTFPSYEDTFTKAVSSTKDTEGEYNMEFLVLEK